MSEKIKILFLAASPMDTARLRLDEEVRDIEQSLRVAPKSRSFQLISQWAVRSRDLMEILMIHRPTIVHFSGHASQGKLILENDAGGQQPVEGKNLAALLATFRDTLRLVVLNACFTSGFNDLRNAIDYTVGTTSTLSDRAAIRFSSCFYQALAFDNSVEAAYERARCQISLEELEGSEIFTLLVRAGVNASESFVRPRSKRSEPRQDRHSTTRKTENSTEESNRTSVFQEPVLSREVESAVNDRGSSTSGLRSTNIYPTEGVRGLPDQLPPEIQESLKRFRLDYPDAQKVAFLMMRFGKTKAHENIVAGIRNALDPLGVTVVRADDKQYHDDLFPNVLTYVYGCGFGIAVFERIEREEFNPNVALEVGYMFALRKQVCLLKDRTLDTLQADLVGKLYRVFDPLDPIATIPHELTRWLKDKGL